MESRASTGRRQPDSPDIRLMLSATKRPRRFPHPPGPSRQTHQRGWYNGSMEATAPTLIPQASLPLGIDLSLTQRQLDIL